MALWRRGAPLSHCVRRCLFSSQVDRSAVSFYQLVRVEPRLLVDLRAYISEQFKALGILGRIYISDEGINAQISVPNTSMEAMEAFMASLDLFSNLFYNHSTGAGNGSFDKLKVKIRDQIVADGLPKHSYDINDQPAYLEPESFHRQVIENVLEKQKADPKSSALLLDVRNIYECQIGKFAGSTQMDSLTFRASLGKMLQLLELKHKEPGALLPIYMYCTGGIRCSKAGALFKSKGYKDVRMLKGGITHYGHYVMSNHVPSLFLGKNFTFDNRKGEDITEEKISQCAHCHASCSEYVNCVVPSCNRLFVQCRSCSLSTAMACSATCKDIALDKERLAFHRALGSEANKRLSLFKL